MELRRELTPLPILKAHCQAVRRRIEEIEAELDYSANADALIQEFNQLTGRY